MQETIEKLRAAGAVFSGSFALKQFGMLHPNREIHDIDIVFETGADLERFCSRNAWFAMPMGPEDRYEDDFWVLTIGDIKVDAFTTNDSLRVVTENGYQVQHYKDIWTRKIEIMCDRSGKLDETYRKHLADFNYCFNN
jgi:hypothetical protein